MKRSKNPDRLKTVIEQHPVALTDRELIAFGQRLAQAEQQLAEHEARADAVKKDLKAQEQKIVGERSRLAMVIRDRAELRDVKVTVWRDVPRSEVFHVRDDTGEEVHRRPVRMEELQVDGFELMGAEQPEAP